VIILSKQIKVTISAEEANKLDQYCKTAGASRSKVIEVLLSLHLDELIVDVSKIKFLDKDGNEIKEDD
jgi:hypothetical protein